MIGLLLITIALSAVLTFIVRQMGIRAGLLDVPDDGRKQHALPVPALGGIAVFTAFAIALTCYGVYDIDFAASLSDSTANLLGSATVIWILGIVDDVKPVRAKAKLVVQIVAALAYVVAAKPIEGLHIANGVDVSWEIPVGLFCVFWLVACCNAVNLLDGMDGMASLQGMLGFTTLAIIASLHGDIATATICLLLVASVMGFAIFNAPPASIFLGDAGSMTIGYLLGALSLSTCHMLNGRYGLAIPLAVMIIPAFDTTMAIIRRAQKGKGIMAPDREHFHHCLFDAGRSVWRVLGVFSLMFTFCAAAAVAGVWASSGLITSLACGVVLVTCVATRTFGHKELTFLAERLMYRIGAARIVRPVLSHVKFFQNESAPRSSETSTPDVITLSPVITGVNSSESNESDDKNADVRRAA